MTNDWLAELFFDAANVYLSEKSYSYDCKRQYSCDSFLLQRTAYYNELRELLEELGCPTSKLYAFNEFKADEDRQGARYLWLMMCYEGFKRGLL